MKGGVEVGRLAAYSLGSLYQQKMPPSRSLGLAIVVAAIADYRGADEQLHRDAARFLFPETQADRQHYGWAIAMQTEIDADWLREALDKARSGWDQERSEAATRTRRKEHEKRIRLVHKRIQNRRNGVARAAFKPSYAESAQGPHEAAQGV